MEFHPFSISSYPGSGGTFSLHIKSSVASANGWTSRLMKYMKEHENRREHYKDISVQIEGPFGELTLRKELSRYEHVVFIGGGIGITPLDSLYNQLVTDLLDNNFRRTAMTRKIDFIFTTRSRSLITEFASRNTAWHFYAKQWAVDRLTQNLDTGAVNNTLNDSISGETATFNLNPLSDDMVRRTSFVWKDGKPHIQEISGHSSSTTIPSRQSLIKNQLGASSLTLAALDKEVGCNKPKQMVFSSPNAPEFHDEDDLDIEEAYAQDLAVDSLEINNSTHITRVKDVNLRREYKATYPFINFKRPNIRGIIYNAASTTHSKDICVLTSGPKGMINECKRWAAEIGVDIHSEIFDW